MMSLPLNIILRFRQQPAGNQTHESYHIHIVQAPVVGWGGSFRATAFDQAEVRAIRKAYGGYIERGQTDYHSAEETRLAAIGQRLFTALPSLIQARLYEAQRIAQEQGRGLTLILQFEPSAFPLLDLPWELLASREWGGSWGLQGGGVWRQLVFEQVGSMVQESRPGTILGVWATPSNQASLSDRQEYGPNPSRPGAITWLQGANTLAQLQAGLATGLYDGLHITAHGLANEANNEEVGLAFENEAGQTQMMSAEQLAVLLRQYPAIRFVYLDVCATGTDREEQVGGGLARLLIQQGVGMVVVMQEDMGQRAAGVLARVFYEQLGRGVPVEQALTQGRQAIRLELADALHWSVPALYSQQTLTRPESQNLFLKRAILKLATLLEPIGLGLFLLSLIGQFARQLGAASLDVVTDWAVVFPWAAGSVLIPLLVGAFSRGEQTQFAEEKGVTGLRQWLTVLGYKYLHILAWSGIVWIMIWLVWLVLYQWGVGQVMSAGWRQAVWGVGLLLLAGAGYTGTWHGIVQASLTWERPPGGVFPLQLFIFMFIPLLLLIYAPFMAFANIWWPFASVGMFFPAGSALLFLFIYLLPRKPEHEDEPDKRILWPQ